MNKAQVAAIFLAGAAAGVGGAKLSVASTPAPQVRVHALDLRTGVQLVDGGFEVTRRAYGTITRADGGVKDVGAAKSCAVPNEIRAAALADEMKAAASECDWDT